LLLARAAALLIAALALLLYIAPATLGLVPALGPPAALVLLALGLWATGALPAHQTALLVFVLATVLEIAPPAVIFSGFASTGLWLVFGGLVIAAAIEGTGLGRRLARLVVAHLNGSYGRIIYGSVAIGVGLSFLVPAAMGRILILLPIFRVLASELGFTAGSRGALGIMLAAALGSFMPSFAILPANLPNMVLLGAMETIYGIGISYGQYLVLQFPVLGLAKAVLLAELIRRLFPDRPSAPGAGAAPEPLPPWSGPERRLFAILVLALGFWATDWLHGISPGWIALAAALLCLLPGIGVIDTRTFETRMNFSSFIYVAGMLGMVSLIDDSGLARALGGTLLEWLPLTPDADARNFAALVGVSTLTTFITAVAGMPAVLTPLAAPMADAADLPLITVLMTQVFGFSSLALPYQSPPLMVALQIARIPLGIATRLTLILSLATLLLLVPLGYLWWRWLGYLG
jgi:di/tricarboxylate transporter